MNKLNILSGKRILETRESPINGTLTVEYELGWGTFIRGGGLPQSGGLAKTIWEKSLKEVKTYKDDVEDCLILGFGGGGIAHIIKDLWKEASIYGVDIDPVMVELGRKYLKWEKTGARVVIQDAQEFVNQLISKKQPTGERLNNFEFSIFNFDLICVDMYVQDAVPEKFNTIEFIEDVGSLLKNDGLAIFNRLYGARDRKIAIDFAKKLEKVFSTVNPIFPHANVMYVCSKDKTL